MNYLRRKYAVSCYDREEADLPTARDILTSNQISQIYKITSITSNDSTINHNFRLNMISESFSYSSDKAGVYLYIDD